MSAKRRSLYEWNAESIRALRLHMGLSQQQMSEQLGVRQQTVSEWETGVYQPRGGICTLLTMVAERAGFVNLDVPQETTSRAEWLQQPLARLSLKPRAVKALERAGMHTVGQVLVLWQQGEGRFLELPDFGQRSLEALLQALRRHGLIY